MNWKTRFASLLVGLAAIGLVSSVVLAQHSEHPEHPMDKPEKNTVSKKDLAKAISTYIKSDSALKGGHFLYYDQAQNAALVLDLVRVHDDKLAQVGDDTFFACTDLKGKDGSMYDLDFFMKGTSADDLRVTQVSVHKKDGVPRYDWKEEGGIWKQIPVK